MRRPVMVRTGRQYLRLVLAAVLSIAFLAGGSIAAALLFKEANGTTAAFLFMGALAGMGGCIFFFSLGLPSLIQERARRDHVPIRPRGIR
jgi:hypothetical protein